MQTQPVSPRNLGTAFEVAVARKSSGSTFFSWIGVFVVVIYVSNAYSFVYRPELLLKPLYWHLLIMGFAALTILARSDEVFVKYPRAFLAWIAIYLGQLLISYLYSSQTEVALDHLIYGLETSALLFSFVTLLLTIPTPKKTITNTLLIVVIFSVCINYLDFFVPSFSETAGRAAGFYENPNSAGYVIAISMVLSSVAVPRRYRLAYCVIVGTGVLITFSRSSWILWAIGMIGLSVTGKLFLQARLASFLAIGTVSIFVIYSLWSGGMLDVFYSTGFDKYLDSNTIARLSGGESISQDGSIGARAEMARISLVEFQQHPWFGAGLGATKEWLSTERPHNLYLMVAVEAGIFGLLVLWLLIGILWRNVDSVGRVAVVMYAVSCLFSHNNLEQAYLLCLIAIMIVVFKHPEREPIPVLRNFARRY